VRVRHHKLPCRFDGKAFLRQVKPSSRDCRGRTFIAIPTATQERYPVQDAYDEMAHRDNVYREALPGAYELQLGNGKTAIWRNFNRHDAPVAMRASIRHLEHIHSKVSVGGGIWRHRQDRGFQPVLPVV
jgi:hypothetical protein